MHVITYIWVQLVSSLVDNAQSSFKCEVKLDNKESLSSVNEQSLTWRVNLLAKWCVHGSIAGVELGGSLRILTLSSENSNGRSFIKTSQIFMRVTSINSVSHQLSEHEASVSRKSCEYPKSSELGNRCLRCVVDFAITYALLTFSASIIQKSR